MLIDCEYIKSFNPTSRKMDLGFEDNTSLIRFKIPSVSSPLTPLFLILGIFNNSLHSQSLVSELPRKIISFSVSGKSSKSDFCPFQPEISLSYLSACVRMGSVSAFRLMYSIPPLLWMDNTIIRKNKILRISEGIKSFFIGLSFPKSTKSINENKTWTSVSTTRKLKRNEKRHISNITNPFNPDAYRSDSMVGI